MGVLALTLLGALLPVAASASGRPCSYRDQVLSVTLPKAEEATVARSGSHLTINGRACSAGRLSDAAAVSITDAYGNDLRLTLEVPAGGFRAADGAEISFEVSLRNGADTLSLQGTGARNGIEIGGNRVNLNTRSNDTFELVARSAEGIELRGGAGSDRLISSEGRRARSDVRSGGYSTSSTSLGTYPKARIFGGAGNDTIYGDAKVNVVWAGPGDDTVYGAGGDDEVQGGDGNDVLWGGDGDDLINGGPGNDTENGAGNNDLFQQGPQDVYTSVSPVDIPDVGKALSPMTVPETTLSTVDVNVRVYIDHPATQDLWVTLIAPNNNRVRLAERRGNGTPFNGTHFDSEANTNIKTAGALDLSGRFHPEWSMELVQGFNPTGTWTLWVEDKVSGSVGKIRGWELELGMPTDLDDGSDTISGGGGGFDLAVYTQRNQAVTASLNGGRDDGQALEADQFGTVNSDGTPNNDVEYVYTGFGDDTITGNNSKNDLRGYAGHDSITALGEADQIRGMNGQDTISGGDGADAIHGQANPDTIDGGNGFDRVFYGYSTTGMTINLGEADPATGFATDGEAGNDDDRLLWIENISATRQADTITGNDLFNVIWGTQGDDWMDGRAGTDTLDGAEGTDTCLNGESTPGCEITSLN